MQDMKTSKHGVVALLPDAAGHSFRHLVFAMAAICFTSGCSGSHRAAHQQICSDHMRQIALALQAYHDAHGAYPPPAILDAQGAPMHSWRAIILQYTDFGSSFGDYNFSEPWNSPHNRLVTQNKGEIRPSRLYSCPNATLASNQLTDVDHDYGLDLNTNYLMVTFKNKSFYESDDTQSRLFREKVVIVEVRDSNIHWAEPRDVAANDLEGLASRQRALVISSNDPDGPAVLFSDGTWKRERKKGGEER